jgi:RNA-directed DNA polymerase
MPTLAERAISDLTSGAVSAASLGRPQQAAIYRICRSMVSSKQMKIANEVTAGRTWVARRKQNELVRCLPARLLAAQAALHTMNKRRLIPPSTPTPFSKVWNLANDLRRNMSRPSFGSARLKRKATGTREVVMFDLFDVAKQKLVAMSIRPFVRLHPAQFALEGGRSVACEELLRALTQAPENARIIHVDVQNFYGSINREWLQENLPLSASIIQRDVFPDVLRWHLGLAHQRDEGTDESGRWGIPQGSAVSPTIAEFVMASVLQAGADLLEGLRYFNYSDNLAVVGVLVPCDLDVTVFMERLAEVFRTHQAGPFQLRFVEVSTVTQPFRFLGYHFQKTERGARAFLPEHVAFLKEMKFERDLLEAETIAKVLKIAHAARSYCAAFALWEGAAAMQARILQIAADQRARITRQTVRRLRARPVRIGKPRLPEPAP